MSDYFDDGECYPIGLPKVGRHEGLEQEGGSVPPPKLTEAPCIETNERGGKQSALGMRFDLIDPGAMARLAKVLHLGSTRYGDTNWRKIDVDSHLNHAMYHINCYRVYRTLPWSSAKGESEDHLAHALCRIMMALVIDRDGVEGS